MSDVYVCLPSRELTNPPWEKETHLQNAIFGGYVSSLVGMCFCLGASFSPSKVFEEKNQQSLQCFPLGNRTCFRFHDRVTTATSTINNAAAMETNSDTAAAKVASTKRKEETQRKYLALEVVFFWLVVESTHLKKYESNRIISPGRGEIKIYLQPPPSFLRRRLWSYPRPLGVNRS